MPWTSKNPPAVAKNWTPEEQAKCVEAANAVLAKGGKDDAAIFACIRAAGKGQSGAPAPEPGQKEESLDRRQSKVRESWRAAHQNEPMGKGTWVREVFDGYVIVEQDGADFIKVPWGRDADGSVNFGEPEVVKLEYVAAKDRSGITVLKAKDGTYRWVGWVSNKYRDIDSPPEILTEAAHREYVAHADRTKEFPELRLWHVPGSKIGQADWLEYADGFLLASGSFDKGKEDQAERLATAGDLAMSHGFTRLAHDSKESVTTRYRTREISVLPRGAEANPWTTFETINREVTDMSLSKAKRQFLASVFPEETVVQIEANTANLKAAADAAGVDFKEVTEGLANTPDETTPEDETPTEEPKGEGKERSAETNVKALADELVPLMVEGLQLKALSDDIAALKEAVGGVKALEDKLKGLEDRLAAVQKSDDEKVANLVTPKGIEAMSWFKSGKPASQSATTKLDPNSPEDQDLKARQPSALADFVTGLISAPR